MAGAFRSIAAGFGRGSGFGLTWLLLALLLALPGCSRAARESFFPGQRKVAVTAGARVVRVEPGDTLYDISRRHQVALRDLIDVNGLNPPYALKVGQSLRLPGQRTYTVRSGDTLSEIARNFGVDMRELVQVNRLGHPDRIAAGQQLVLPQGRDGTQYASAQPPRRPALAPAAPARATPPTPGAKPQPPMATATPATPVSVTPPRAPSTPDAAPVARPAPAGGRFLWPTEGRVISAFGPKDGGLHNDGINIAAPRGQAVRAAEGGTVAYAGNELRGYGNLLLIRHDDGWVSAYSHMDRIDVAKGARVARGQVVGAVGATGAVDSPQLHFELRQGSRAVDPERQLAQM